MDKPVARRRPGRNLQQLRERAGLSASQLARKVGCQGGAIGLYERGEVDPSLHRLVRIASALNCTVGQIAGTESLDPTPPPATPPARTAHDESLRLHALAIGVNAVERLPGDNAHQTDWAAWCRRVERVRNWTYREATGRDW